MATADDNGGGQQRRRMMMACRFLAADYDGEGQEWAARDGKDSGVAMMAAAKMVAA
jgi:hypothetical protein